jgi:hypothetical protein
LAHAIALGELEIHRGDLNIRQAAANKVLHIFYFTNVAMFLFLLLLLAADVWLIVEKLETPQERIIDRGVIKTLIGATVVHGRRDHGHCDSISFPTRSAGRRLLSADAATRVVLKVARSVSRCCAVPAYRRDSGTT